MREHAVLHAGEEDDRELESLGGVQSHQRDDAGAVLVLVGDLVRVGDQRHPLQERGEPDRRLTLPVAVLLFELQGYGGEFLEVLDAGLVLRVGRGLQLGEVAGAFEDGLKDRRRARPGVDDRPEVLHQRVELLDRVRRPRGHAVRLVDALQRLREADLLALREGVDHRLGTLADAALGDVEDAAQRDRVLRVGQYAEVGQDVPDLLALVEADSADDLVGQADADEDLLEDTGLRIRPVEDGDVSGLRVTRVGETVYLLGDELRLVVLGVGDVAGDLCARARVGPQVLGAAGLVALDDRVGRAQDRLRGAVVLLQEDRRRVRVVLLELEDVADRRAPEGVDRLVGVAHDAQLGRGQVVFAGRGVLVVRGGADEFPYERVLRVVGVLVLVDHDVPEAAAVVLGDVREGAQQVDRRHDQVVEVERVGLAQPRLVHGVGLGEGLLEAVGGLGGEVLLVDQLVLQVRDLGAEGLRRELLRVDVQVAADQGHQALGVGGVVDRERGREAELLRLAAQDADARAVEGHHPHRVGTRADELLDALLHLARGLVGEGDREDLPGVHIALAEEVGDAVGEHAGLAGAGAGHDEQRGVRVNDGRALVLVQPVQEGRRVHHRAGGAVPVVGVPARRHVELPAEQVVRNRLRAVLVLGRGRGLSLVGTGALEIRQEAVVKEAAHRLPSLGRPTDNRPPPRELGKIHGPEPLDHDRRRPIPRMAKVTGAYRA